MMHFHNWLQSACLSVAVDVSSIKDLLLRVKEMGTKARLYEPSLAKASEHLLRLGAENDKERSVVLSSDLHCYTRNPNVV